MSSGCGDVLSLQDLQTAKKHQLFEAEVITGKQGGVSTGANIDYATNQVTGQTQKTRPAVLRDAGFRPASFTFTTGGTLGVNDADLAVLWPMPDGGDGNYYAWKGSLPKIVPAGSTPNTTGGVSSSAWVAVSEAALRSDLASPGGTSLLWASPGRTQADKNSDVICVLDEGAKADSTNGVDGTDSTAAFLSAITKCKTTGKSLSIPKGLNGYRLTQTIDVRGINILDTDASLYINHAGIGVIFGGNASNPNNPYQGFGTVIRVTGIASRTTPDMRGIGIKGQHIHVESCDYLQVYANDNVANYATDYSCGYSELVLKRVSVIELFGETGSAGWINENKFYLNRTNKIIFVDGLYQHNHNKFYGGNMEGPGLIDLPVGRSNYFYDFRFERSGSDASEILNINFGPQTWQNIVEATWKSSPGYTNEPYNPLGTQVVVNDQGRGNTVCHAQDLYSDEVTIFGLSEATPFISFAANGQSGNFANNTDMHGVSHIQHLIDGRFKCTANFANLLMDERRIPVRNGDMIKFNSDANLFRPCFFLYDASGNLIQTEPSDPETIQMPGKVWNADGYYTTSSNTGDTLLSVGTGISAIRVQINSGSAASGLTFKYLRVTGRFYKYSTSANRKSMGIAPFNIRKNGLSYFSAGAINMASIAGCLPCYKNDMTEMKINLVRQRYLVKSVAGNTITVAGASVQYFDVATSAYVAYTSGVDNAMVQVSSVSGSAITLVGAVPADIIAGKSIDFIITKTKLIS